jgi:hypothetical protein
MLFYAPCMVAAILARISHNICRTSISGDKTSGCL